MDLAKVDPRSTSLPQKTFRQDTTLPRGDVERPAREINTRIQRPDTSDADQLARILGLANETGQNILGQVQANHDQKDAGAASLDFAADHKDDQRFAKSRAYRDAWQLEGAKKLSIDIGDEVSAKVTERLNDSDNPATLEEIDGLVEGVFRSHVMDEQGNLHDFGTPQAKATLGNALREVRAAILPQAQAAIKKQTDERMLATVVSNRVYEHYRGASIGVPDSLAPLPEDGAPPIDTSKPYYVPSDGTVLPPFKGFMAEHPSSGLGAPREGGSKHNGEDYPVPVGTQIVAPMQGTVLKSFSNARGGNQVRIKMADGAIVGFAHLSKSNVKTGDSVGAGDVVALSGNTGHTTGAHVHVTVEVNGKKVSPKHYFASAKAPSGLPQGATNVPTESDPQLASAASQAAAAPSALPPFDFEGAMQAIPSSIDRGTAKAYVLQALVNTANGRGDIGILAGLEDSHRKDGTPSLSPKEIAELQQAREQITDKARIQSDRARKDLWDKNGDSLMLAVLGANPPSEGFIVNAAQSGKIDPSFAYTLISHERAEVKADASEARREQREADAEANADLDADVGSRIAARMLGDNSDSTPQGDLDLYSSGKLGVGKKATARYRQLVAARHAGETENLKKPEVAMYVGQLKKEFGTKPRTLLESALRPGDGSNWLGVLSFYRSKVASGEPADKAFQETRDKFAKKPTDPMAEKRKRIAELQAQRLGQGR